VSKTRLKKFGEAYCIETKVINATEIKIKLSLKLKVLTAFINDANSNFILLNN